MTPSHRLKLYRSDKHLKELKRLASPIRKRREHPVIEVMEPQRKAPAWIYTLDLSSVRVDERFPIVFGDYLFNVRSALDHLIVAIAPRKYKRDVSFPIHTKDPLAADEATGNYLDAEAARTWALRTQGLPDECVACLKALQPYEYARLQGGPARSYPLAMLSAFQNADKHRELVAVITGLAKAQVSYDGVSEGVVPTLNDRAELLRSPTKVNVKIEGTPLIGIRRGKTVWGLDEFTYNLNAFVDKEILPRLEPFLG